MAKDFSYMMRLSVESGIVGDTTQVPPEASLETAQSSLNMLVGFLMPVPMLSQDSYEGYCEKLKDTIDKDILCLNPNSGLSGPAGILQDDESSSISKNMEEIVEEVSKTMYSRML
ncbi:hypothetical protein JCM33374_g1922 [Metschnikowia sp. JCM 33374]|nr:hypothetical protein JCM33374_g1922 [Metschnikowia sp. JCM 33374]